MGSERKSRIAVMDKPLTLLQWKLLRWLAKPYLTSNDGKDCFPSMSAKDGVFRWSNPNRDFTVDAHRAANTIRDRGWLDVDAFGNYRLNAAGHAAAAAEPEPGWAPPVPPPLKDRDMSVLHSLAYRTSGRLAGQWVSPMDVGGHNGSHHSATLRLLVRHGLAICKKGYDEVYDSTNVNVPPRLFKRAKGSCGYQVTEAGLERMQEMAQKSADNLSE